MKPCKWFTLNRTSMMTLTLTYVWTDQSDKYSAVVKPWWTILARVGSTVTAMLTVTDAYGASDTISKAIYILNTDPVVDTPASISANPSATTDSVLTCSAIFTDYNDGNLTPSFVWSLSSGSVLANSGNTYIVDDAMTNPTTPSSVPHLQPTTMGRTSATTPLYCYKTPLPLWIVSPLPSASVEATKL